MLALVKERRFDYCGDCAEVKHRSVAMRNTSELRSLALVCFVVIIRSSVCMFILAVCLFCWLLWQGGVIIRSSVCVFILLFFCVLFSFCRGQGGSAEMAAACGGAEERGGNKCDI